MSVRVKFGPVEGSSRIVQRVNAAVIKEIANAGIRRTQGRRQHPATAALTAQNRGAKRADIVGPRGGPGIIRPVTKRALYWPGAAHPYAKVNGVGFEPLIEAETGRVGTGDISLGAIAAAIL